MLISLLSMLLTPTWLMLMQNTELIPHWLRFIRLSDPCNIPLIWQLLILEFAIDGLRLAAVNTPKHAYHCHSALSQVSCWENMR